MKTKNIILIIAVMVFLSSLVVFSVIFYFSEEDQNLLNGYRVDEEATRNLGNVLSKANSIESLRYVIEIETETGIFMSQFWQKGEKIKMETTADGRTTAFLLNKEGERYSYVPGDRTATKLDERMQDTFRYMILDKNINILDYDPVVIGREILLDDKDCYIVLYEGEDEMAVEIGEMLREDEKIKEVKLWIWKDYGIPLLIEKDQFFGKTKIEVKEIDTKEIPDYIFELPEGIEVTESMMLF